MHDIDEIRRRMKNKKRYQTENEDTLNKSEYLKGFISRLLICTILVLFALIVCKSDVKGKDFIYKNLYETNFFFSDFNKWYTKNFGSLNPVSKVSETDIQAVFNEKLTYKEDSKYLDGVKLIVEQNYLVPVLETGIVTFIGEKEGYGKTIIIQSDEGLSTWYGNITNEAVKLYDYIEKGKNLGETKDNKLYLVFKKDGKGQDYQKYIK